MTTDIQTTENISWQETPPLSPALRHYSGQAVERQLWLDKLAEPLQRWVKSYSSSPGMEKFKDILRGTWLGHPVHPMVTDIPIGSWTATMLLDFVWLGSESPEVGDAADATLALGLVGAGAAAITGLTD